tara:strand:- start:13943 stop:15022 length:1080 start_codon:yes stop_codon:yes gene_type:complete
MVCTAAPQACAGAPDDSSEAADFGTFCHDIAARALDAGKDASSYLGRSSDCGRFEFDEETADHLQTYLDAVRFAHDVHGGELLVEQRVRLTDEIWGTADAMILSADGRHLVVIDLKMGAGVYVNADSVQLAIYAGAALSTHSLGSVERITAGIVQPRHRLGEPWREHVYTRAELDQVVDVVTAAAVSTHIAPRFQPGDHCQFCPIKATCAARRQTRLADAQEAFSGRPSVDALTDDRVAELVLAAPEVKRWLDDVETHARKRAEMGKGYPGLKLVQKVGLRAFSDESQAETYLRDLGIDPLVTKLASPAEAERRLAAGGLTKKQAKATTSPITHKPVRGALLVPVSDRRPEFKPTAFPL